MKRTCTFVSLALHALQRVYRSCKVCRARDTATRDRESYAQILFKVFHFVASKLDSSLP
jgi:hypothetical protein